MTSARDALLNAARAYAAELDLDPHNVAASARAALARRAVIEADAVKSCPRCRRELPLTAFGVNRARRDGRQSACRACRSQKKTASSLTNEAIG